MREKPELILSIHDVSPQSLPGVETICKALTPGQIAKTTLLVIPGKVWSKTSLEVLRDLERRGCMLAGHGWSHRSVAPQSAYHRLHSRLLSRNAAEHLSVETGILETRIRQCYQWFETVQLNTPVLYVPPAWAMGSLTKARLRALPFVMVEFLAGVYHTAQRTWLNLPLVGFEADTLLRSLLLSFWNRMNYALACGSGKPLRVAIHPIDLQLKLRNDLRWLLSLHRRCRNYSELFS